MIKHTIVLPQSLHRLRSFPCHYYVKRKRKIKTVPKLSNNSFGAFSMLTATTDHNHCHRFFSSPITHRIDIHKTDENRNKEVSINSNNKMSSENPPEQGISMMQSTSVEGSNSFKVGVASKDQPDQEELTDNKSSDDDDDDHDDDHDDTIDERKRDKRSLRQIIQLAWSNYKSTWEGFFDNLKSEKEDDISTKEEEEVEEQDDKDLINLETIQEKQKEIRANLNRNLNVIKKESGTIVEVIKETTGMRNKRDVKMWAMEQLKLANECVAEFMKGYRAGRDEEMDKMMNEYFKDIDLDFQQEEDAKGNGQRDKDKRNSKTTDSDNNTLDSDATDIEDGTIKNQNKSKTAGRIRRGWIQRKTSTSS
mmetsp:Transcript_17063/g.32278  ORF Transcript_17063/g.32278 Transcript_17063/m.32278 type:complete len:364 (-) Transcript_17063:1066-2157(-)